jgi:predicted NAD/FAD-binding protein
MDILSKAQGENNIWVCGSYCLYGMPLLENAVCSGLSVAEALGGTKRPWSHSEVKKVNTVAFTVKATLLLLSCLLVALLSMILK